MVTSSKQARTVTKQNNQDFEMADRDDNSLFDLSLTFSFGKRANLASREDTSDEESDGLFASTPLRRKRQKSALKNTRPTSSSPINPGTGASLPTATGQSFQVMAPSYEERESDQQDADMFQERQLSTKNERKKKGEESVTKKAEMFRWTEEMITDMVDLVANTATLRK